MNNLIYEIWLVLGPNLFGIGFTCWPFLWATHWELCDTLTNYNAYNSSGVMILALQGRYLFPVIYTGYALMASYLSSFQSPRLNAAAPTIGATVFVIGEFPWNLKQVNASWYFGG